MHKQQVDGSLMVAQKQSKVAKNKKQTTAKQLKKSNKIIWSFLLAVIVLVSFFAYKITRPLEIKLGSVTVNQQNYSKVSSILTNFDQQKILLVDGKLKQTVKLADLGAEVNKEYIKKRLSGFEKVDLKQRFAGESKEINIKFKINADKANSRLDPIFLKDKQVVLNPKPIYDSKLKEFIVKAGHQGQQIDLVKTFAKGFSFDPEQTNQYQVVYLDKKPKITEAEAKKTADYINQRLNIRINLKNKGRQLYFPDPWDIADWVRLTTDSTGQQYQVDFDEQAINKFLNTTVMSWIQKAPVNKLVLNDSKGKFIAVLRQGRPGYKAIGQNSNVPAKIKQALIDKKPVDLELTLVETGFKTEYVKTDQSGKWLEVDLSSQTVNMWIGSQKLQSFLVSTGLTGPTPPGTYHVWHKTAVQDMVGGSRKNGTYYNLKNVHWNTYFTYSGIAFHEAYWHNNFGHPMSHGCVNMRLNDAKIIYDFAPIGTKVVVHE